MSLQHDQTFYYQNRSRFNSKPDYRVYFSYSGKDDKMLSQETDECQLIWYVSFKLPIS